MSWQYRGIGIPEEEFITGDVPITKTEIRILSLAKLELFEAARCLDIGCGTGSVTVEMAIQCPNGDVTALDKSPQAVDLTRKNVVKFGLQNVKVIGGDAPGDLLNETFDRIFLGGGSQRVEEIVKYSFNHLREKGILVVNTILLDSTYKVLKAMESCGFSDVECICANISRGHKVSGWMMKAMNPIYIIKGTKQADVGGQNG